MGLGYKFEELGFKLTIIATLVAAEAKPGCESKCGNVSIPYPFGAGNGCNINNNFFIRCNKTFNPPKAFLSTTDIEVLYISLDGYLRVQNWVGYDCYSSSGRGSYFETWIAHSPFPISNTRNKFTAIGCDTYAFVAGSKGPASPTACVTFCNNLTHAINGSCSGLGCCQAAIPKGMRSYKLSFDSFWKHSKVLNFNPCSYGFVVEDGAYNFSVLHLSDTNFSKRKFPIILDWAIGNQSCAEAGMNPQNYACKRNSICINGENGNGYWCKCPDGFQGNPYLSHGCQATGGVYNFSCSEGFRVLNLSSTFACFPKFIPHHRSFPTLVVALGICLSIGLLFLVVGIWWLYKKLERRKNIKQKGKFFKINGGLLFQKKLSSNEGGLNKAKLFSSEELETATDQYNKNRILGRGAQGIVYKGMLHDGRIVAIKKSKIVNQGYLEQFINEIVILSQIDHKNVVKLLGCCLETEVPLLIYEFIPNGTLSHFIHDQNEEYPRSWDMRLRIATEVASAVSYLHSSASVPIYHRDIKSSNILLDEKFRAKVSDFGTSRLVGIDQTHLTTQVQGTFGYLDPEYFQSSQFTEKSDVYSFGVVLVELLTAQKAVSTFGSQETRGLVSYFMSSMEENRLLEIVDGKILKDGERDKLVVVAHLAKRCLNLDGRLRPTMKEVTMELERIRTSQGDCIATQPKQVKFVAIKSTEKGDFASSLTGCYMNCGITSTPKPNVHPLMFHTV
ncbi:hypothetical protein ES332_A05G260200v1 [Gossypium tomentosum]|uniref:Protein kinase domain-containing protein n=1 Tax=Gossypium tomentosum TaxID=34277 RepID=A0A5D2QKM9_GOSTO|nr:hypothetical protein ES332_A05G260200v1 [Gossypium tomentosum]